MDPVTAVCAPRLAVAQRHAVSNPLCVGARVVGRDRSSLDLDNVPWAPVPPSRPTICRGAWIGTGTFMI